MEDMCQLDGVNEEQAEQKRSLKEELFSLRFQHAVNQLDNTARLKDVKKDIARIKTVLRAADANQ